MQHLLSLFWHAKRLQSYLHWLNDLEIKKQDIPQENKQNLLIEMQEFMIQNVLMLSDGWLVLTLILD